MIRLLFGVLCTLSFATSTALGQTSLSWRYDPDPTQPGQVFAYASTGRTDYVSLACSQQYQGLIVAISIEQSGLFDSRVDDLFLRVGGLDYLLQWTQPGGNQPGTFSVRWPDKPTVQRWVQQDALLSALSDGTPLRVMASRQPDRSDARGLISVSGGAGDPAIAALNHTCGRVPSAPATTYSHWSLIGQTELWTAPTAVTGGFEGFASLALACGGDGQPIMAVEVEGYRFPDGRRTLSTSIDGRQFQLNWFGWKGYAVANLGPGFLLGMKSGSELIVYSPTGDAFDFTVSGGGAVLDQALARCTVTQGNASSTPNETPAAAMLSRLKQSVRARVAAECASYGGTGADVPDSAFEEVYRQGSPFSDIWFNYGEVSCIGGSMGWGAGNCGAAKCLNQRYLPGDTDYFLSDEILR